MQDEPTVDLLKAKELIDSFDRLLPAVRTTLTFTLYNIKHIFLLNLVRKYTSFSIQA